MHGIEKMSKADSEQNMGSKVWRNLTIPSQGASDCLFLSPSDLKSHLKGNLNLLQ